MTKTLTAPLAQVALHKEGKMPPARPSPPSSRPVSAVTPVAPPPKQLHALSPPSGPDRSLVATEEGAKKKRSRNVLDEEGRAAMMKRYRALRTAEPDVQKTDHAKRAAAEFGVSKSVLYRELQRSRDQRAAAGNEPPKLELAGLEAFIEWHVKRAVRRALKGLV